jgi:hypothetical protein
MVWDRLDLIWDEIDQTYAESGSVAAQQAVAAQLDSRLLSCGAIGCIAAQRKARVAAQLNCFQKMYSFES